MTPPTDSDELNRRHCRFGVERNNQDWARVRQLGASIAEDEDRQALKAEMARIPNTINLS